MMTVYWRIDPPLCLNEWTDMVRLIPTRHLTLWGPMMHIWSGWYQPVTSPIERCGADSDSELISQIAWAKLPAQGPHFALVALCEGRKSSGSALDTKCMGRARSAWAAIQRRGSHWVHGRQLSGVVSVGRPVHAPPLHLPRNAHAVQLRFHARGTLWAEIARHVKD